MKKSILFRLWVTFVLLLPLSTTVGLAQERIAYQEPSQELISIVSAKLPPEVIINRKNNSLIFTYSDRFLTLAQMEQSELRLAGLRVNPNNRTQTGQRYINKITIKPIGSSVEREVTGLPQNPMIANLSTSSTGEFVAFTHTTPNGVELWLLNVGEANAHKLTNLPVNALFNRPFQWLRGGESLLVRVVPQEQNRILDYYKEIPKGPITAQNFGNKVVTKTPQDLLKNSIDENNFEELAKSELHIVNIDGTSKRLLEAKMVTEVSLSPDQNYYLITTLQRPFSFFLPMRYFPKKYSIYDTLGREIKTIYHSSLKEYQRDTTTKEEFRRAIEWRSDKPSTLFFVTTVNRSKGEKGFYNSLNLWDAPFNKKPYSIAKTKLSFQKIYWRSDKIAIYSERSRSKLKKERLQLFDPSNPHQAPILIKEWLSQDLYENPGKIVTALNREGKSILRVRENSIFFIGEGFSHDGQKPFVDKYSLKSGKWERVYESGERERKESIKSISNLEKGEITVTIESQKEYPNYYYKNITTGELKPLTNFGDPIPQLSSLHRELIRYTRSDGVELSATLLLPSNYNFKKGEKLPLLLWAYPREYGNDQLAGQIRTTPYDYFVPSYISFPIWATKGYAVLHLASFPIVSKDGAEPNDGYLEQLIMNAKAAIDAVDKLGYIDRSRVGVGGHSYGAFMTANLLSHTSLFACGVASAGAYNRTLTPYGFQNESRSFWSATNLYSEMSPFNFAQQMKTPLLLVHGEEDDNTGTYTIQTYRYYQALKGQGADVRMVILPREKHRYRGIENILHLIWEKERFFETYLRGNKR